MSDSPERETRIIKYVGEVTKEDNKIPIIDDCPRQDSIIKYIMSDPIIRDLFLYGRHYQRFNPFNPFKPFDSYPTEEPVVYTIINDNKNESNLPD